MRNNEIIQPNIENKSSETESTCSELFDSLINSGLDEDGNLIDNFYNRAFFQKLFETFGETMALDYYELGKKEGLLENLIKEIKDQKRPEIERIILIDLASTIIDDSTGDMPESYLLKNLKKIADDPDESIFMKAIIYQYLLDSLVGSTYPEFVGIKPCVEKLNPSNYHEKLYDDFIISVSKNMAERIIESGGALGGGTLSSHEKETEELSTPDDNANESKMFYEEIFSPAYKLISSVDEKHIGIFTHNGLLVGISQKPTKKTIDKLKKENEKMSAMNDKSAFTYHLSRYRPEIVFGDIDDINLPISKNLAHNPKHKALIKHTLSLPFKKNLDELFNINLSSLPISVQIKFLEFTRKTKNKDIKIIKKFFNNTRTIKEKQQKIISFLSLEIDSDNGKKLLDIDKILPAKKSKIIFAKLAEIINYADKQAGELGRIAPDIDVSLVRIELLKKAHEIITLFASQIGETQERKRNEKINNLIIDLKNNKADIALLASVLRVAKSEGQPIDIEKLQNLNLETKSSLSPEEIEDIIKMSEENWQQIPALQKTVTEDLKNDLKSQEKEQEFIVLKYKGETIGFLRFEKRDNKTIYAGSLNVYKELRGLKIAEQSLLEIIKEKSKEKIVHATASPKIQAGTCYIEKTGFVGTGYIPDYHNSGEPLIEIEIDLEKNKNYSYREEDEQGEMLKTLKDIISEWQGNKYQDNQDIIILKYDFSNPEEFKKYHEDMQKLLNSNDYVMTRYFKDAKKEDKDERYLVLEKK